MTADVERPSRMALDLADSLLATGSAIDGPGDRAAYAAEIDAAFDSQLHTLRESVRALADLLGFVQPPAGTSLNDLRALLESMPR